MRHDVEPARSRGAWTRGSPSAGGTAAANAAWFNEVFRGRFGATPGVRTTIAAAGGIPGDSLVEIDCIATTLLAAPPRHTLPAALYPWSLQHAGGGVKCGGDRWPRDEYAGTGLWGKSPSHAGPRTHGELSVLCLDGERLR